jgi:hypothetical protein
MQRLNFTRDLLIVQTSQIQDPSDWIVIQQGIERDAADIEVRIARQRGDCALAGAAHTKTNK